MNTPTAHADVYMYRHACVRLIYTCTYIHIYMHTPPAYAHITRYRHTYTHSACTRTYIQACMPVCTHQANTNTHAGV